MLGDWKRFSKIIVAKNGNPSLKDARECGIPDGYFNEICMIGLTNEQLVNNAKKVIAEYEKRGK